MSDRDEQVDRRAFPRLQAPLYSRPARLSFGARKQVLDVSRSGARIYSDEFHAEGSDLELTLFLAGGEAVECTARVVWTTRLARGAVARYEVGLAFLDAQPALWTRIEPLLVPDAGAPQAAPARRPGAAATGRERPSAGLLSTVRALFAIRS